MQLLEEVQDVLARDFGPIVFVYNENKVLQRSYDANMLARIWLQLGPEKFFERYRFEWRPSAELEEKNQAERGAAMT